jgi:hypothetical protein
MKTAAAIARFVLGLVFVVFGLNGFLNFMPMGPVPALAGQFAGALIQSHYMAAVLTLEIVSRSCRRGAPSRGQRNAERTGRVQSNSFVVVARR